MTKLEFINRYGEDAWERHKTQSRKWNAEHKECHRQQGRKWKAKHKEQNKLTKRLWNEEQRKKGSTCFCRENYELIENYELAKADDFDPKKWRLHHRLENYWSSKTLIRKGLYYKLNPEALIWLPADEHHSDKSRAAKCPELSKWHQRIYERV